MQHNNPTSSCCGVSNRRLFLKSSALKTTALGFGHLALSSLLHETAQGATLNPLAQKLTNHQAPAKRVIFLFMKGGPSGVDTFDYKPQLEKDDRPFVIAHPDSRFTQIPARDGIAHGGIQRSNRFPNCSYFTNWKSLDGKITWTAEVEAPGEYEVALYYTCPKADVGSEIELSFQDQSIRSRISVAHDPPVRGAEHDRVKRHESYVKEFRPLKMGSIRLEKGKGELTLKAISMPGGQVMEFRLIMLKRAE